MDTAKIGTENRVDEDVYTVVAFQLAEKTYALPLNCVVQIIPMVALTPIPRAHRAVEGIMNFRGQAVPIINLRRYFDLEDRAVGLHTPIILIRNGKTMGLIVDEVLDVVTLPPQRMVSLVEIMPEGLGQVPTLEGVAHTQEGAMLMMDLSDVFSTAPVSHGGNGKPRERVQETAPGTPPLEAGEESETG